MKLKKILKDLDINLSKDLKNINIYSIANSTKDIKENCLFICIKGQKVDGHCLKQQAKMKGAIVFLVEEIDEAFDGIQILVKSTRVALSIVARNFFKPKSKVKVVGITGTNGKTTTTFMLAEIFKAAKINVGIIGTIGSYYNGKEIAGTLTTPDPIELFKMFKQMAEAGVKYVVMEVSAHAIFFNKVKGVDFCAKGITNLSEDHLDFFENMEEYFNVKLDFMKDGNCVKAVNIDDIKIRETIFDKKALLYGINDACDVYVENISQDTTNYTLVKGRAKYLINWKMVGSYNIENALCASSIAFGLKINGKHIQKGLQNFKSVPGRMNVYVNNGKKAIIDFAHTPDAMEKIIKTTRVFTSGKLICVFGCGGDRDPIKRPIMGKLASEFCDYVYITNDNPRTEKPEDIANMVKSEIKGNNFEVILDRKLAIKKATDNLNDGDVLLILGKGAENYMEIDGERYPYSDKLEIEKWGFECL